MKEGEFSTVVLIKSNCIHCFIKLVKKLNSRYEDIKALYNQRIIERSLLSLVCILSDNGKIIFYDENGNKDMKQVDAIRAFFDRFFDIVENTDCDLSALLCFKCNYSFY